MIFYLPGFLIALILGFIFTKSIKVIFKIIINALAGLVLLYIANLALSLFMIHIDITPFKAFLTGVIGIPAVITFLILEILR